MGEDTVVNFLAPPRGSVHKIANKGKLLILCLKPRISAAFSATDGEFRRKFEGKGQIPLLSLQIGLTM